MIYRDLLKTYGVHLFDEDRDQIPFNDYAWLHGWAWWDSQPFRNEGLVRHKTTDKFYRLTSTTEMRGRLQYRIYQIGPQMDEKTIFDNDVPELEGADDLAVIDIVPVNPEPIDPEVLSMLSMAGRKGGAKGHRGPKVNSLSVPELAGAS